MSVNLVLPPLSTWASSRLTALLESKTEGDFNTAFDAMFGASCTFNVNGETVSRDGYRSQLLAQSAAGFGENATTVTIQGQAQVEVGNQGQLAGLVGIFYSALSDSKFLVLGAPSEKQDTSSLNLVIKPTEKNPQNPNLHIHGYFDPRRVTSVNQVVSESTYHVTIPHAVVPKTTTVTTTSTGGSKVELGPGPLEIPPGFAPVGPFGGIFGPGPVKFTPGPGPVVLPPSETGVTPETLPGFGEFGAGPVITSGETVGEVKNA